MTARVTLALVAVAASLLGADSASACSCVPPDPSKLLKQSDGAFVGRLVAIREVEPPAEGAPISSADPVDYVYRVGRVYKRGPGLRRGRRVRVRSVRSSATCGLPRGRGRLYGLFVSRKNHRWNANLCKVVTPAQMRGAAEGSGAAPSGARRCARELAPERR